MSAFRDADWLSGDRARAWCLALAGASALLLLVLVGTSQDGMDLLHRPLGGDFISFWSASRLALDGAPAAAYDIAAHRAMQWQEFPASAPDYYAFFYPPTFLLLCLWLGALPYLVAVAAWLAVGLALLAACVRRVLPQRWGLLALLAFPAVMLNAVHGQNGFLSAACLGGGMVLASRRPFWAGACLGLLVFKPHLLLAAPVILLAARRWPMIAGGACSGLGLAALSWAVLGTGTWQGFLAVAPLAQATLELGLVGHAKLQSAFAAVMLLQDGGGGGVALAYAVQAVVTVAVLAVVAVVAARRAGGQAEGALLATAAMLCSPFLLDYDLVCLALPLAWVTAQAQRTGFLPWERLVLLAGYVLPLVSRELALYLGVPLAPLVIAALLLVVARRARASCDINAAPHRAFERRS